MTVNPEADLGKGWLFRNEGIYTFRFDTDGYGVEDVSFKVRFSAAAHAENGDHEQAFTVLRAEGTASRGGVEGVEVVGGHTSQVADNGVARAFTGQAPRCFRRKQPAKRRSPQQSRRAGTSPRSSTVARTSSLPGTSPSSCSRCPRA